MLYLYTVFCQNIFFFINYAKKNCYVLKTTLKVTFQVWLETKFCTGQMRTWSIQPRNCFFITPIFLIYSINENTEIKRFNKKISIIFYKFKYLKTLLCSCINKILVCFELSFGSSTFSEVLKFFIMQNNFCVKKQMFDLYLIINKIK